MTVTGEGTAEPGTVSMARRRADGSLVVFEEREATADKAGYRAYHVQTPTGGRERYPSVTTVRDRIRPKEWMRDWAEEQGVRAAVRAHRAGALDGVELGNCIEVIRKHGWSDASSGRALDRGKHVHTVLENFARAGTLPNLKDHPEDERGYVQALMRWLLQADLQVFSDSAGLAVERVVAHVPLHYAGRYDLRAYVNGVDTIVDLKTRPRLRVYFEDLMQLTGYALADVDCGSIAPDKLLSVVLGPNGQFVTWPIAADLLAEVWAKGLDYHNATAPFERAFLNRRRLEERAA